MRKVVETAYCDADHRRDEKAPLILATHLDIPTPLGVLDLCDVCEGQLTKLMAEFLAVPVLEGAVVPKALAAAPTQAPDEIVWPARGISGNAAYHAGIQAYAAAQHPPIEWTTAGGHPKYPDKLKRLFKENHERLQRHT